MESDRALQHRIFQMDSMQKISHLYQGEIPKDQAQGLLLLINLVVMSNALSQVTTQPKI